jgi:hypothetical protein
MCVCLRKARIRRSGAANEGRLRRPCRPFQVIGVLAAVQPVATNSLQLCPTERAATRPITENSNLGKLGERLDSNPTIQSVRLHLCAEAMIGIEGPTTAVTSELESTGARS